MKGVLEVPALSNGDVNDRVQELEKWGNDKQEQSASHALLTTTL